MLIFAQCPSSGGTVCTNAPVSSNLDGAPTTGVPSWTTKALDPHPLKPTGSSLLVNIKRKPGAGGKLEPAPESHLTVENPFRVGDWILALVPWGFPYGSAGKESTCNVGDLSWGNV